jgi:hypothetical protein
MHNWWWGGGGRESGNSVIGRMREVEKLGPFRILERELGFGVYLPSPVFYHGHLYVAISWVTSSANIKIFSGQGPDEYMRNVVYKEVLEM